jgi:hypothetical protein
MAAAAFGDRVYELLLKLPPNANHVIIDKRELLQPTRIEKRIIQSPTITVQDFQMPPQVSIYFRKSGQQNVKIILPRFGLTEEDREALVKQALKLVKNAKGSKQRQEIAAGDKWRGENVLSPERILTGICGKNQSSDAWLVFTNDAPVLERIGDFSQSGGFPSQALNHMAYRMLNAVLGFEFESTFVSSLTGKLIVEKENFYRQVLSCLMNWKPAFKAYDMAVIACESVFEADNLERDIRLGAACAILLEADAWTRDSLMTLRYHSTTSPWERGGHPFVHSYLMRLVNIDLPIIAEQAKWDHNRAAQGRIFHRIIALAAVRHGIGWNPEKELTALVPLSSSETAKRNITTVAERCYNHMFETPVSHADRFAAMGRTVHRLMPLLSNDYQEQNFNLVSAMANNVWQQYSNIPFFPLDDEGKQIQHTKNMSIQSSYLWSIRQRPNESFVTLPNPLTIMLILHSPANFLAKQYPAVYMNPDQQQIDDDLFTQIEDNLQHAPTLQTSDQQDMDDLLKLFDDEEEEGDDPMDEDPTEPERPKRNLFLHNVEGNKRARSEASSSSAHNWFF